MWCRTVFLFMKPALFLDRDGVIIENRPNYVRSWADVEIYPQAVSALAAFATIPHKIIIVTNQSGVGRGIIPRAVADAINVRLVDVLKSAGGRVDGVYICPHAPQDACQCRKPRAGMLVQAAAEHGLDLAHSIMIGDALTDVAAGQAAGVAQTVLLRTGRGRDQLQLAQALAMQPFSVYDDLSAALHALFDAQLSDG
jgi:D-glycero-D-manno-heptose 1,7-bisphosphate phosphatase